jgi:hypothetical protein
MMGVLVGTGAVLVILGDLQMSPGPAIAPEMTVAAALAIHIHARLLSGRS